jgi:cytochrome c biogenesis protein CcmG, thiol:disulfide interchange protein DsbE
MKKFKFLSLIAIAVALLSFTIVGELNKDVPSMDIKTLDGSTFNTSQLKSKDGKPVFVSFWAQWCTNCIKELNAISEVYPDWEEETGVKIYAISIDSRNQEQVGPFAAKKGWEYEVLLDSNSDFFRAVGGTNPPYSFIIDGNGKIVWAHTGYHEGDEDVVKSVLDKYSK